MLSGIFLLESIAPLVAQAAASAKKEATFLESVLPFAMFVATLVLTVLLAGVFARALKLPDFANRIAIVLGVVGLSALMITTNWPPRFGVDLRGGINYIGQLDLAAFQGKADRFAGGEAPTAKDIIPSLKRRVDPSGILEILIRALDDDKIEVIMPQVDMAEADNIWDRLVKTGHLQFRILADRTFHSAQIELASKQAESGNRSRNVFQSTGNGTPQLIAGWYDLAREEVDGVVGIGPEFPIKEVPSGLNLVRNRETGELINMSEVPFRAGVDPGRAFARWLDANGIRFPQVLLIEPKSDRFNVEGEHLSAVGGSYDQTGRPCITFALNGEGAKRMQSLTSSHLPQANGHYRLAIVLDDALQTAPTINSPIGARGQIEGRFTPKEVNDLKIILDSGKISVALVKNPISKQFLESTLGAELKSKGLMSIGISLVAVLFFMQFYYRRFAGSVSCLALLLNLLITLAVVMAIKQPLTLTGLAGLVLTIGMSVDANVLIFERIREELGRGSSLRVATQNGFDRAFVTIVDSNLTTLLTAVVLYILGTDQIKGFSVTLIVGILTSMFTAVFVSRLLFDIFEKKHWLKTLSMADIFPRGEWNFMNWFRPAAVASLVAIGLGIVALTTLGSKVLDIDLRGGSTAQISFVEKTTRADVEKGLAAARIEHHGEPVDFVVSELRGSDDQVGFEYKIDSSIPSYDPTGGEKWKELDEILTDVFGPRLVQRRVTYDPASILVRQVGGDGAEVPAASPDPAGTPTAPTGGVGSLVPDSAGRSADTSLPALAGGLLTLSDAAPQVPGTEAPVPPPAGTVPQETPVPATAESTPPLTPQDAPPALTAPPQDNPAPAADPAAAVQNPAAPATGTEPPAQQPDVVSGQLFSASLSLKFDHPITAKSVRTQLVEASRRQDRLIEESQIRLSGRGVPAESIENASLTEWDITMETNNRDDAAAIMADWAGEFNNLPWFKTSSGVGAQIAGSTQIKAFAAVLASLIGIIIYIWLRFQNLAFGLAAAVALVHDVLVVLGAIAISHYVAGVFGFLMVDKFKISLQIIAALLTIMGYSLNDTIVIFDRIREIRGKRLEMTSEMINRSVSQTLSRTILTSLTTLVVCGLLYIFGGSSIHGFAFALVVGVIAGTYSTVFVASPILLWLMNRWGLNAELNAQLEAARS